MSKLAKKCPKCKGRGIIFNKTLASECSSCLGSGVMLSNDSDSDDITTLMDLAGQKFPDEEGFIDIEEDDYDY